MKSKNFIPCSVGILTLNVEQELPACLESFKDFAEIVVCDGNSTDGTLEVAKRYGAKIIKQYETDEPNLSCAMDKAAVRQKNMEAAGHDWYFFMDADDTLSPEAAQEIYAIVSDPRPKHLIWRMPTRVFIGGKEILHEATYPSYQVRLVHKSVGARFKNPVHDHLVWDAQRFPVGTMRSFYNFHWSEERVRQYRAYLWRYADRELQIAQFREFGDVVRGFFRRARTIGGYLLWRLPVMYARWGMKSSMPLSIELTIVGYHCRLLMELPLRYFSARRWLVLLRETARGKDLNRALSNYEAMAHEAYGRVLDVGGGDGYASYWRFLRRQRWHRIVTLDIDPKGKPDVVLDLEKDELPFPEHHFDTLVLFNVLEHLGDPAEALRKLAPALRKGGTVLGVVPFLVAVHPDPHDYQRFTDEGLELLFNEAGYHTVRVVPIGTGAFGAGYYQIEFLLPRALKFFLLPLVLGFDAALCRIRPSLRTKFPLSYFFEVRM